MANKKRKTFTREHREGVWGRFHDARLPGDSDAPVEKLTDDYTLPGKVILDLWEKANQRKMRERGILPQITNPVSTAVNQWRDAGYPSQKSSKKTANTHSQYARTMRRYLEACGDHDIDDYSWDHAKIFQDYLEDDLGLGDGTVNKEQRHLQVFISWCYNTQKMKQLVVPPKVSVSEKVVKVWTRREIQIYKQAIEESGDINLLRAFYLCYYHVMRMSEVWMLKTDNIRLNADPPYVAIVGLDEEIKWLPKMGLEREVEIHNPTLLSFLKDDIKFSRKMYIDSTNSSVDYSKYGALTYKLNEIRDRLDIPQYEPLQTLRRSGITLMVEAGELLPNVHDMCGHRSMQTTEKYYRAKRRRSGSKAAVNL